MLPKGTHLRVPTGQHVYLKQVIAGKKNWECGNGYIRINPFHSVGRMPSPWPLIPWLLFAHLCFQDHNQCLIMN